MDPSELAFGLSRETKIRRDRLGRWFNDQDRITHPKLVRLFNQWVDKADDGRYCLRNDINWAYVDIEGPPYFVRGVRFSGNAVCLLLSDDTQQVLDPTTLTQDTEGHLYCRVKSNRLLALFDNHALMQLEEHLVLNGVNAYFDFAGQRFEIVPSKQLPF